MIPGFKSQSIQRQNRIQSSAWKRVVSDQDNLLTDMPKQIKILWPNEDNIMNFDAIISPDDNYWKGCHFPFSISVPDDYPISPPKVLSKKVIYHPNIDLEGKVCLNILREDWKPVSELKDVMFGLLYLFLTPNATDPLNKEAAEQMLKDTNQFQIYVNKANRGETINGIKYDKTI